MPGEALDAVEAGGEDFGFVGDAIAIGVFHQHHRITRGVGLGIAILGPHAHKEPALGIKSHRAGLADEGFLGEELDAEFRRHSRQGFGVTASVGLGNKPNRKLTSYGQCCKHQAGVHGEYPELKPIQKAISAV